MIRVACAFALALGFASLAMAQDKPKTGFVDKTFKNADGTDVAVRRVRAARLRRHEGVPGHPVPARGRETKSARGGAKMPVEVGIGPAIKKREKTFPFIAVIPQAEKRRLAGRRRRRQAGPRDARRGDEGVQDRPEAACTSPACRWAGSAPGAWPRRTRTAGRRSSPICGGGDAEGRPRRSRTSRAGASTATRTTP